jgi:hypothetical protein
MPDVAVGESFSHSLLAFDNAGSVTWSITPGGSLPPGVTLAGNVLSGTPTVANSYTFSLDATDPADPAGIVRTATFTLRVSTYRITSPLILPAVGIVGTPFSYTFTSNAPAGTTWSLAAGNILPVGYTLAPDGTLSTSEVLTAGTFSVTVMMTPPSGVPETRRVTWFTRFPNPLILDIGLASTQLADLLVGGVSTVGLSASGGLPPYAWSVAPGSALPPGLSLLPWTSSGTPPANTFSPASTTIVGVPTTAGQYAFDLIVTDSVGAQMRRTYSLKIAPFTLLTGTLKTAVSGAAYAQQLTAVGGSAPYIFTMNPVSTSQDMLPPGLSLST